MQKDRVGARVRDAGAEPHDRFSGGRIQPLVGEPNGDVAARVLDDQVVVEGFVQRVEGRQRGREHPDTQSTEQAEQRHPHPGAQHEVHSRAFT